MLAELAQVPRCLVLAGRSQLKKLCDRIAFQVRSKSSFGAEETKRSLND